MNRHDGSSRKGQHSWTWNKSERTKNRNKLEQTWINSKRGNRFDCASARVVDENLNIKGRHENLWRKEMGTRADTAQERACGANGENATWLTANSCLSVRCCWKRTKRQVSVLKDRSSKINLVGIPVAIFSCFWACFSKLSELYAFVRIHVKGNSRIPEWRQ